MKPTAYEGAEPFIFASYAHKDDAAVYEVLDELQRRGYRLWYDDGIEPGSEWPEDIARHLDEAAVMLAFITPAAMDSSNCRREINYALHREKPLLAVMLEPTEMSRGMEMQLSAQQMVVRQSFDRWDQFIGKILRYPKLEPCRIKQQSAGNAQDAPPAAAAGAASAAPRQVRVSFDPSGTVGIGSAVAVVRPGEPVLCPDLGPYARPGLLPVAWCEAPDGTGPCHAPGSPVAFARDTVLYVKWTPAAAGSAGSVPGRESAPAAAPVPRGGAAYGSDGVPKSRKLGLGAWIAIGIAIFAVLYLFGFMFGRALSGSSATSQSSASDTTSQTSASANASTSSTTLEEFVSQYAEETTVTYDNLSGKYVTTGLSGGYLRSASLSNSELTLNGGLRIIRNDLDTASVGDKTWVFKVDAETEFGISYDGSFHKQSREEFATMLESLAFPALVLTIENGTVVQAWFTA